MMTEYYINGKATTEYGIQFEESALATLMTPAPNKEDITNTSRAEHGTRVLRDPYKVFRKERNISIKFALYAHSKADFFARFKQFCTEVLETGEVDIESIYEPDVVYKCRYMSCDTLTYYNGKLGKFTLQLYEPNPADRTKKTER